MNLHEFVSIAYEWMEACLYSDNHFKGHDAKKIVLSRHVTLMSPEVWTPFYNNTPTESFNTTDEDSEHY